MAALLLAAVTAVAAMVAAETSLRAADAAPEDDLLRQIKSDVFDGRWEAVLAGCDKLIAEYPHSEALARTYYYRAKGLHHMEGREDQALAAYGEFIERFPAETLLREDANISRMSLAKSLWLKGKKDSVSILMKGLEEKGYPGIYAALQISHLDNRPARARALPLLKDCARGEKDAELRNECTLGILRIDPSELPAEERPPAREGGAGAAAEPKLIRLEVREKVTGKVTVAVNLPIAFAEALLASLSEFEQGHVLDELKRRNIDVNNIWKSLKTLGRQTLVQIETEEASIRIWLE